MFYGSGLIVKIRPIDCYSQITKRFFKCRYTALHIKKRNGVQPVFRQPRIHTRQYLNKYCMNQSGSRKDINNPK